MATLPNYKKILTEKYFSKISEMLTDRAVTPFKLVRALEFNDGSEYGDYGNADICGFGEDIGMYYKIEKHRDIVLQFLFNNDEVLEEIKIKNVKYIENKGYETLSEEVIYDREEETEKLKEILKDRLKEVLGVKK